MAGDVQEAKRAARAAKFGVDYDKAKLKKRQARFGFSSRPLPASAATRKEASEDSTIRMEAIHLHGTDKMSTKDLIGLFNDYCPSHIEWYLPCHLSIVSCIRDSVRSFNTITLTPSPQLLRKSFTGARINDSSANVVWADAASAGRVLWALGEVLPPHGVLPAAEAVEAAEAAAAEASESAVTEAEAVDAAAQEAAAAAAAASVTAAVSAAANNPFAWRLLSGENTPALLMRLAAVDDVKRFGAAKESEYYKAHAPKRSKGASMKKRSTAKFSEKSLKAAIPPGGLVSKGRRERKALAIAADDGAEAEDVDESPSGIDGERWEHDMAEEQPSEPQWEERFSTRRQTVYYIK